MSVMAQLIPQTFTDGQILNAIVTQNASTQQQQSVIVTGEPSSVSQVITVQIQPKAAPDDSLDVDKQAIYRHPLFPLMALLFEKCEKATQSMECPPESEGFDVDIQAFVHLQERDKKSIFADEDEIDGLMVKAIQVLRIHLLELEKVNDLCKDFCNRYTSCLKGKLQSENLLRAESDYDQSMFDEPPDESGNQPVLSPQGNANIIIPPQYQSTTLGPGQIMSGGTVYQMVQTPQGLVAQPIQIQPTVTIATPMIHGSTPLSQIGISTNVQVSTPQNAQVINTVLAGAGLDSDDDEGPGRKKPKRGVLPKSATQVMKSWLFQHIVHPYPSEEEKRQIASQTNLTLLQINNWFINARRRILQPMMDASNPEHPKTKKSKPSSKPPGRFWPFASSQVSAAVGTSMEDQDASREPAVEEVPAPIQPSAGQTIILPPGAFLTADGQIMNLNSSNMTAMLNQVRQVSPSPPLSSKDTNNDTNNNSHSAEEYEDEEVKIIL